MPGIDQAVPVEAPVEAAPQPEQSQGDSNGVLEAVQLLGGIGVAQKEQGNPRLLELLQPAFAELRAIASGGQQPEAPQAGAPPVAPPEAEAAPRIERDPNAARGSVPI